MKVGTVLIVKNLSVIEVEGGNSSDMIAGEEVTITSLENGFLNTSNSLYGSFTLKKDRDGLNWETFFSVKGKDE